MINLVIVTGVTGSGKSTALYTFEESGYYVVDNIPLAIVKPFFETLIKNTQYTKVALAVPLGQSKETFQLACKYKEFKIHFFGITCSREILNERYRLSRKRHPLQSKGYTLDEAISNDFAILDSVREELTDFVDTSKLTNNDFAKVIHNTIVGLNGSKFSVMFMSFGYKRAVPQDIETVFDVRLLPNPYWVPELKNLTGLDEKVKRFVLDSDETKEYLKHVIAYLEYYLDSLRKDDRRHANIGIACSGGQHRSVVIAEYLANYFKEDYATSVSHRDIYKK